MSVEVNGRQLNLDQLMILELRTDVAFFSAVFSRYKLAELGKLLLDVAADADAKGAKVEYVNEGRVNRLTVLE